MFIRWSAKSTNSDVKEQNICLHTNVRLKSRLGQQRSEAVTCDLWQNHTEGNWLQPQINTDLCMHEEFKAYGRYEKRTPETFLETWRVSHQITFRNRDFLHMKLTSVVFSSHRWKTCRGQLVHLLSIRLILYSFSKQICVQIHTERKVLVSVTCYYSTNWSQFSSLSQTVDNYSCSQEPEFISTNQR